MPVTCGTCGTRAIAASTDASNAGVTGPTIVRGADDDDQRGRRQPDPILEQPARACRLEVVGGEATRLERVVRTGRERQRERARGAPMPPRPTTVVARRHDPAARTWSRVGPWQVRSGVERGGLARVRRAPGSSTWVGHGRDTAEGRDDGAVAVDGELHGTPDVALDRGRALRPEADDDALDTARAGRPAAGPPPRRGGPGCPPAACAGSGPRPTRRTRRLPPAAARMRRSRRGHRVPRRRARRRGALMSIR